MALSGLVSCVSYTERTAEAVADFERGRFDQAREAFRDEERIESPFLRGAESGMVALAAGRWQEAQEDFDRAASAAKAIEERALLGPDELGESLAALLLNEAAASYSGEGYERVQLHAALALTYLARGNLDGVYVEVRRANKLLETEEALYDKRYLAGGLGHLISAVSYELQQRLDEAYIDYKRMHEKGVGTELAGRALVRIASKLDYRDELPGWVATYGEPAQIPHDAASIVVVAGVGLGPYKLEQTLGFMTPHGLVQLSVPVFVARPQAVTGLDLQVDGGAPLRTSVVEDVAAVAAENLSDRIAWLAARTALRAVAKTVATDALADHLGDRHGDGGRLLGLLAGSIFTALTERADTRAWMTLPHSWHAARMFVDPGEHRIELHAVGGETRSLGSVTLEPGETLVVLARSLGTSLHAFAIGGAPAAMATPSRSPSPVESNAPATP